MCWDMRTSASGSSASMNAAKLSWSLNFALAMVLVKRSCLMRGSRIGSAGSGSLAGSSAGGGGRLIGVSSSLVAVFGSFCAGEAFVASAIGDLGDCVVLPRDVLGHVLVSSKMTFLLMMVFPDVCSANIYASDPDWKPRK